MHSSLSRLLAVVVVVVVALATAPYTLAAAPPSNLPTFPPAHIWPGILPASTLEGNSRPASLTYLEDEDYPVAPINNTESRIRRSIEEDFTRQMLEAQQRYHQDLMMMHRLMEEQLYPVPGPYPYTLWPFPLFLRPPLPEREHGVRHNVAKDPNKSKDRTQSDEEFSGDYSKGPQSAEEDSVELELEHELDDDFLDSPTPGPEWNIIPFLPPVPDADDLPDKYNNSTSTIHIVNGSIVEINSTTHKDTSDNITTFLHTEVINILPDESKENSSEVERGQSTERTLTSDKVTTKEPHPTEGTIDEERTEAESPEHPTLEGETDNSIHAVPVKLVHHEVGGGDESRPARGVIDEPKTTKPQTTTAIRPEGQRSAAYVKQPSGRTDKKGKKPARDLSGDTLVNNLPGHAKTGKPTDPDAETIPEELI